MLDFHTHLIWSLDDGSRSADETAQLFEKLEETGFDSAVLSPHFYSHKDTVEDFAAERNAAFEEFKKEFPDKKVYLGAECYLHEYLFSAQDITSLCIEGTRYLLTELSYRKEDCAKMLGLVSRLAPTYNVVPVLAHMERYPYILNDEKMLLKFMDTGCFMQVNLKSFGDFFLRAKLLKYVQKGYIHFIGTDTHRLPFDDKTTLKAISFLEKHLGEDWRDMFGGTDG